MLARSCGLVDSRAAYFQEEPGEKPQQLGWQKLIIAHCQGKEAEWPLEHTHPQLSVSPTLAQGTRRRARSQVCRVMLPPLGPSLLPSASSAALHLLRKRFYLCVLCSSSPGRTRYNAKPLLSLLQFLIFFTLAQRRTKIYFVGNAPGHSFNGKSCFSYPHSSHSQLPEHLLKELGQGSRDTERGAGFSSALAKCTVCRGCTAHAREELLQSTSDNKDSSGPSAVINEDTQRQRPPTSLCASNKTTAPFKPAHHYSTVSSLL